MELDAFVERLIGVKVMPSGVAAQCPAHHDQHASLSVNAGEHGGIVVKCHAGCTTEAVVSSLGLTLGDLMGAPHVVETYQYVTAQGQHVYAVERWANPKTFRCVPNLPPPGQRVLYNWPAVAWAIANGQTVYIVEGERDVNTLAAAGVIATTNVGGAGKWLAHYADALIGAHLVVVADNDAPGRAHARAVAGAVKLAAASVGLMHTPIGKDVTDLLSAGYGLDRLAPLPELDEVGSYRADRIRTRSVNWGWAGYVPLGKLSMVEGDPGDGKSLLTIDLASRWSTGTTMPDGSNGAGPWPVILVSAEDDMDDTIVPRLIASGARLDHVHLITHGLTPDEPFDLINGVASLRALVMATGAKVIMLDPLAAFLGDGTDSHNDHSVRRALQPLKTLAEQTGAAVLVVRHLNKGAAGTKAIYRSSGSIGFVGAARAAFIVAQDPNDPAMRIMACTKTNLARKPPSLRYEITSTDEGVPFVRWKGPAELSAQMILDGPGRPESEAAEEARSKSKEREYAGRFLLDTLANGPLAWKEILEIGKEDGQRARTLERARADVGLVKIIGPEGPASTKWTLPDFVEEFRPLDQVSGSPQALTLSASFRENGALALRPQFAEKEAERGGDTPLGQTINEPMSTVDIDEDQRERDLLAADLVCTVCSTYEGVARFGHPWWTIRCKSHNPMFYGGG